MDKSCRKFIAFLGPDADRDIAEITHEHLNRFRNEQLKAVAARTVNHDLKHLGMLFRDAKEEGYVIDNPSEFVKRAKITSGASARRPFTIAELKSLLEIATPEWQSLIKFGLYTGQRLGDIAWLTWSNIDTKRGEIRLVTRKRDKTILIPIAGPLQNHILSLPNVGDPKSPIHPEAYGVIAREGRSNLQPVCRHACGGWPTTSQIARRNGQERAQHTPRRERFVVSFITPHRGHSFKGRGRARSRRDGDGRARFGTDVGPLHARRPRGFGKGGFESARLGVGVDDLHRRRLAAGYFGHLVNGSGELDHSLLILISQR
jgi:integrase